MSTQHMSPDVLALELVKIEKNHPSTLDNNKDAATLFEQYYKKVKECTNSL